jgi:hypothetical protein
VISRSLLLLGVVFVVLLPSTADAHPISGHRSVAAQPDAWVVNAMFAALAAFVLIVGGAMTLRLRMHRRRLTVSARTNLLLTMSMAACAVVALVAFVATQLMPISAT